MITGFNTDIERDGVVYHVQTEDKGLDSPLILSLVYSGGEILAAKRTPYQDLIAEGFTDEALAERLKRQHRLICAAINAGRIEELKKMSSGREEGTRAKNAASVKTEQPAIEQTAPPAQTDEVHEEFVIETSAERHEEVVRVPSPPPAKMEQPRSEPPVQASAEVHEEFVIETSAERHEEVVKVPSPPLAKREQPRSEPPVQASAEVHEEFVIETSAARPPDKEWRPVAEKVVVEPPTSTPQIPSLPKALDPSPPPTPQQPKSASPDAAYTVYDSRRPSRPKKKAKREEELALTILDDEEFVAGQSVTIRALLQRHVGEVEKPLGGVQLSIKVLGATFRPQIYAVKTQRDGVAIISVDLPHFSSGRAAVVIRAEAQGKVVELRRVIQPA